MTTVSLFLSKLLASLMRDYFSKRTSGAPLHTLSKSYDVPVGVLSPSFEAVYCYICGRRRFILFLLVQFRLKFKDITYINIIDLDFAS